MDLDSVARSLARFSPFVFCYVYIPQQTCNPQD